MITLPSFIAIQQVADTHDQVILALIAIVGTSVAALVYTIRNNTIGKAIALDAAEVNAAVNHKDTGELSLYRLADANTRKLDQVIAKQEAFDKAWGNLPAEMGDAVGLVSLIGDIKRDISLIQSRLVEHVEWEMSVKYNKDHQEDTS